MLLFGCGFYLAQLYGEVSALIEQREAALTSAVYSAPLKIERGDDLAQLHLLERIERLSYTRVPDPAHPGEYSLMPGRVTIFLRGFHQGIRERPAALVHLTLAGTRVEGVADSFGTALPAATVEPEVIGRLLPGAPPERVESQLSDIPPYLVRGLLATEDRYFYYHPGFDPIRMIEAAIADLRTHRLGQGASTLTQQLARTFIDRHERTFTRKIRELAVALVIEIRLSKNQILERYINDVPMGAYDGTPITGMPLAARYFFNKDLHEVTPAQAATLIGMIQAPTLYDPRRHPEACRARRDIVLAAMRRDGVIDAAQYAEAAGRPVEIAKLPGLRRAPYFDDYVIAEVERIPGFNGNLAGLKVYTTLDPEMEQAAVESVDLNLRRLEKQHSRLRKGAHGEELEGSMVALDARTGAILAMVGGRDYSISQFNRVTQAERQPGSAFKPIVYLSALDPSRSPIGQP
ncbi:MAG TPA: transglycosylase domain-containing protein, partial [Candidatus Binataceae bacterium]|nr:transglycosylase domain-containing protein [Candidatus Binataceae bacterium]